MQEYNIYLDESSIDNPKNDFMIIGGLFIKRELRDELKNKIKEIRIKHNYFAELKWSKFNKKLLPFGKDIIDLFFSYTDENVQFHSIVVDKTRVAYDIFHSEDKELAFYKFIYQLLQYKFKNESLYYLFLDNKDNSDKDRLKNLEKYLELVLNKRHSKSSIKHIQAYCSKEVQLIQLADFFSGAIGYIKNGFGESEAKKEISRYISDKLGKENLDFRSRRDEQKFNIFQINL
ncbi:MAG: DUF3800 domain-containing protein [Candidatus Gracilibacteria bacterium]|nr:DUF3800 domain-containing protein [Candidatus Gracilibacteria bacterium]